VRFVFGGAISVVATILAERIGPAFGGLYSSFPGNFSRQRYAHLKNMSARKKLKRESQRRCADGNPPRPMHSERRWAASDSLDLR
jgi:hypothetical protein